MKKTFLLLFSVFVFGSLFSNEKLPKDTLYTEFKDDIIIFSTTKETNSLQSLPAAVSAFSQKNLEDLQVKSIKDLSSFVPNYFVPDYGSKMTAPLYIRGVGARSGSQTVSMYVDNIPYFNTTAFDTELYDIQHIEILRGTQGTLYGRNAMGGIMNIYTLNPLKYKGVMAKVSAGSYGAYSVNASIYQPINDKMGISFAGYYNQHDGYFTNKFTGMKADHMKNIGARMKYAWIIAPRFTANYSFNVDYANQGAFPYANVKTGDVNYNTPGSYKRTLVTNGLALKYVGNGYMINSTTGYQYLNDEVMMDTDYSRMSYFKVNQKQQQHSVSQEIVFKSLNESNYQWSTGIYGFYDKLNLQPPVTMMKDGVKHILQSMMDSLKAAKPSMPQVTYMDNEILFDGKYERPTYSAALFHQSTYNNLFVKGLSATAGIRFDYEKTQLEYNARTGTKVEISEIPNRPPGTIMKAPIDSAIEGKASKDFFEILPKLVIKYEFSPKHYAYASVSRGYKAGGHNVQMFADLLEGALATKTRAFYDRTARGGVYSVNDSIGFNPEYSWNYEVGGHCEIIKDMLSTNFSIYYIDIKDVQVTQFVRSGYGRMINNAGTAESKGFEIGLKARPCKGFFMYANYGFSDAKFTDYKVGDKFDFTGNYIPFAPRSTFSVGGNITFDFKNNSILDRISFNPNYSGAGKIYWDEANSQSQGYYGTLDLRVALEKGIVTLEGWGRNVLDEDYDAFLFQASGNSYSQKGKPARWGASLKIKL